MIKYGDRKWREDLYVEVYRLARSGNTNAEICKLIGVTRGVFDRWREEKPAFQKALDDARGSKEKNEEYMDLLYSRLPEASQDLWERINACEYEDKDCPEVRRDKRRVRLILDQEFGKLAQKERQRLFLFTYYTCDFNKSEACRLIGITPGAVSNWQGDQSFARLMYEMQEAKKDLCESALMSLVRAGEPSAVVFANKTLNRDRGYNDKVEVDVRGAISHSVDDLGLTLEEKKKILAAIRDKQEVKLLEDKSKILEAEYVEVS